MLLKKLHTYNKFRIHSMVNICASIKVRKQSLIRFCTTLILKWDMVPPLKIVRLAALVSMLHKDLKNSKFLGERYCIG